MDFVSAFHFHRRYQPEAPALFFPDDQKERVNYSELAILIAAAQSKLADAQIRRGDIVGIDLSNQFHHAVLLLACARAGVATVSGDPRPVHAIMPLKAVLFDGKQTRPAAGTDLPVFLKIDPTWFQSSVGTADIATYEYRPDDLCRIMLTSGSTGTPKPVALTYRHLEDRLHSYAYAFGSDFPNCSRIMCAMRLTSSLGYLFLLHMLSRGGFFCFDSVDFEKISSSVASQQLQALVTTPYTLTELIKYCDENAKKFPRVPLIMTAGGLVAPSLYRRTQELLAERVVVFYGATETGVISSTRSIGDTGDVGFPVPGRKVDIFGNDGARMRPGEIGRVCITASSGPLPFYAADKWQEKKAAEGFFPGDLGVQNADGKLTIFGRTDSVINIGGTKTSPEMVEQVLLGAAGVKDCGVICKRDEFSIDRIIAFLVLQPYWNQNQFVSYCEANLIRDFLPSKFVLLPAIPRTANNKIDREALARQPIP